MMGCQGVEESRSKSNGYLWGLYGSTKTKNNDLNHLWPKQGDIDYFKSKGSFIRRLSKHVSEETSACGIFVRSHWICHPLALTAWSSKIACPSPENKQEKKPESRALLSKWQNWSSLVPVIVWTKCLFCFNSIFCAIVEGTSTNQSLVTYAWLCSSVPPFIHPTNTVQGPLCVKHSVSHQCHTSQTRSHPVPISRGMERAAHKQVNGQRGSASQKPTRVMWQELGAATIFT